MAQKSLSPATNEPFKVQNYYMQIQVVKLKPQKSKPTQTKFTFGIYKGIFIDSQEIISLKLLEKQSYLKEVMIKSKCKNTK